MCFNFLFLCFFISYFFPFTSIVARKPVRKMTEVPRTIARYGCRWMPGRFQMEARDIQAMTKMPATQPRKAAKRLIFCLLRRCCLKSTMRR